MSEQAAGIVVVGGGIAGQAVCEAIRDRDPEIGLVMICGEPRLPYDRVRLSEILVSGESPEALALRPPEWYADRRVEVRLGSWVTGLDTEAKFVSVASGSAVGEKLSYSQLVLATGSQPLMPPIEGIDLPGVYPFRGPEDCEAIRVAAADSRHAAVIGGGLLGLEAARGVVAQGAAVTVVHLMGRLMERQLDHGAAEMLAPAMTDLGVEVQLGRQTTSLSGNGRVRQLHFADGDTLAADLVVVSIGIRAETGLARAAGIDVRPRNRRRRPHADVRRGRPGGRRVRRAPGCRLRTGRADPRAGEGRGRHPAASDRPRLRGVDPVGQAQGDGRRPGLDRRGRRRPVGDRRVPGGPDLPEAGPPGRADQRGHPDGRHPRPREPPGGRQGRRAGHRPAGPPGRRRRGDGGRSAGLGAGLQLQRRLQGRDRPGGQRRPADAARGDGGDARRNGLRVVPSARRGDRDAGQRRRGQRAGVPVSVPQADPRGACGA